MNKPELTKENVLLLEVVIEADSVQGLSVLMLCLRNAEDEKKYCVVGCKSNHVEGVRKALNRIISLRPPCLIPEKPKDEKESNLADTPPGLRSAPDGENNEGGTLGLHSPPVDEVDKSGG